MVLYKNKIFCEWYKDIYLRCKELPKGIIFNNKGYVLINKDVKLNKLSYKDLLSLFNKLSDNKSYLVKKDLLSLLREKRLKSILRK